MTTKPSIESLCEELEVRLTSDARARAFENLLKGLVISCLSLAVLWWAFQNANVNAGGADMRSEQMWTGAAITLASVWLIGTSIFFVRLKSLRRRPASGERGEAGNA